MTFEETKVEQLKILSAAKKKIYDALEKDERFSLANSTRTGNGINSNTNDMIRRRETHIPISEE